MESEWINLSEAAELLGVHPATVRAWGDKGELPMQRTPGGHRRFRRSDVAARLVTADQGHSSGIQLVVQNMVGRARLELTEGALNSEAWYQRLDADARQQLRQIGHRQNARNDGHPDTHMAAAVPEAEKIVIVIEQLGNNDVGSLINFTLQVIQIGLSTQGFDMSFGIPGHGDAEFGKFGSNQFHQLTGKPKTAGRRVKMAAPRRRIAAQRDNIVDVVLMSALQVFSQLIGGGIHQGQMGRHWNAKCLFEVADDLHRFVARRTPSPIRASDKIGPKFQ